jgi:hypothetical protein
MHRNPPFQQGQTFATGLSYVRSWRGLAMEGARRAEDSAVARLGEGIGYIRMACGEGMD